MKLNQLTIEETLAGLKEKKFSVTELTHACLKRIKKAEKKINALITVCEDRALKEAAQNDQAIKRDGKTGNLFKEKPLLGIPLAIKDLFVTRGIKTTAGSKVLASYLPQHDATAVENLKKAGALIIGKANLDAWGHGSSGENSDFGATKNPWNLAYVPGGSSSGSAAAVAAGEALAATGTDTGSSVRLPASFCNLAGLKPTYGRVSRFGIVAMASSLDSPGCLAKNVPDLCLVFKAMAGHDPKDATSSPQPVPDYYFLLKKKTGKPVIGLPREYFPREINPEVKKGLDKVRKVLTSLGFQIRPVSLPHTRFATAAYYILVSSEVSSNLERYDGLRYGAGREKFADEAKRRIMMGTYSLSAGYYQAFYLQAQKVRTLIKNDFDKVFQVIDLLVAPTSPTPPFRLGEKTEDPLAMYLSDSLACPVNLAGLPSLNLPAGFSKNGLPFGFQVIGPQFSEKKLFQVGYTYQQVTDWHQRKPKL